MPYSLDDLFRQPVSTFDIPLRERRQICKSQGHRYQVKGKNNPIQLLCHRCKISWQIGPRTESKE